jgi:rhodanese-related sulfurtransferase
MCSGFNVVNALPVHEKVKIMEVNELAHAMITPDKEVCIIDLRTKGAADRMQGFIPYSVNVDHLQCTNRIPEILQATADTDLLVVHCQFSAHRGPTIANLLQEEIERNPGVYRQQIALARGGFRAWQEYGFPLDMDEEAKDSPTSTDGDELALAYGQALSGISVT